MYISTALQRGWPLAMLVQSIPKAIVASQAVENYGNTSAAMQEDVGLEHGEAVVDGDTDSGAPVVGHGASGTEVDDKENGSQCEAQKQAYEGHGSQAEPQGQEDEGHGSQAEPQGQADEGERIPSIVQQIQNEEEEFAQTQESGEESDEDEDYLIPTEWRECRFGNPVVHDAKQQEWEYRQNERGAKIQSQLDRAAFVANEMYGRILDAPHFEPKKIIREIELEHKYTISYAKAYRAKQKVFEMRFGTYEDSYDNLPRMLATIAERNPKIYDDVMHFSNPEGGKYKGTILTAIGVDGNNQVLPVAFAFVENENTESWYWFLERVKAQVVSSRSNVCLISDRHAGILDAIEKLQHGSGTCPPIWPDVHSRWCMRHLAANFHDHFKNKDLMVLFKRLCSQNQQRKFNAIWKLLDELTAKHQAANSSASSSGTTTKPFSQWIQDKPKVKWTLLYDTNGRRYGIMTTNHAECYNMVMRSSRGLPLVGIVEFILYGCAKYFRERYMAISADLSTPSVLFGKRITKYMETKTDKAQTHNARLMGTRENRFEVSCRDRCRRGVRREWTVQESLIRNDGTIRCSCMKPTLPHLPCSHVLAACRELSVDPTNFVSTFYTKGAIAATWNQELFGYGMVRAYTAPNQQKWYIPNQSLKRLKGRRQTRRIQNGMDEAEAGKRLKQCTQCGAMGHNYKKCPQNAVPSAAEAGPLGNATDGAPPNFDMPSASRARSRRSGMAEEEPTPELLDLGIDSGHRSYFSIVQHKHIATFQCRPPKEYLELDNRWIERLRGAGLLTFCRLVDGGPATNLHPDADDDSVRRSLEAYLLWLFGFIMFKNGTSNSVDKVLIPYAQEIVDAPEGAVPLWSWGSAVLAATYRGLCDACIKDESNASTVLLIHVNGSSNDVIHADASISTAVPTDGYSTDASSVHVVPTDGYSPMPHPSMSYQPMGSPPSSSVTPIRPQATGFNQFQGIRDQPLPFSDMGEEQQHVIGASQLGDAPLFGTQEATQTPLEQTRPHRVHRSPDPLTYSVGHVHAHQKGKRGWTRRGG
ncbi:hypothetical protein U9M48_006286 [Paspalum notatum var. saurae]|uniref:Uncharacterized protein n=1 Tax=Paspalum notatum var. saurae TaxID=547442 RepID=A0AAQ3SKJ9_PASNO